MGSRFINHQLPQRSTSTNGIFLPMLCSRSSTKNVQVITKLPRHHPKNLPSSPKVSCIGQVKNNLRNNKVVGFDPPYTSSSAKPASRNIKYHKLKRLFSGKNTFTPPATTVTSSSVRGNMATARQGQNCCSVPDSVSVDLSELDPPLPVVKKAGKTREGENLWKRRSCGAGLRTLQLDKINHVACDNRCVQPPTV